MHPLYMLTVKVETIDDHTDFYQKRYNALKVINYWVLSGCVYVYKSYFYKVEWEKTTLRSCKNSLLFHTKTQIQLKYNCNTIENKHFYKQQST